MVKTLLQRFIHPKLTPRLPREEDLQPQQPFWPTPVRSGLRIDRGDTFCLREEHQGKASGNLQTREGVGQRRLDLTECGPNVESHRWDRQRHFGGRSDL
jgi:hypothetical protein